MTVISWCTYPVVYLFPMLGITASHAVVGIQVGYCCSDIISKCGVGLLIYQITYAKSKQEKLLGSGCSARPARCHHRVWHASFSDEVEGRSSYVFSGRFSISVPPRHTAIAVMAIKNRVTLGPIWRCF